MASAEIFSESVRRVLTVLCNSILCDRSRTKPPATRTTLFDESIGVDRDVPRWTPRETTRRRRGLSHDGAPWLQAVCYRHGLQFQYASNVNRDSVKRVFWEVTRRTNQFSTVSAST